LQIRVIKKLIENRSIKMIPQIYHLAITQNISAKYAILPGDPGRVEKIASYLKNSVKLAQNREFTTFSGELEGETVLVTSTGIGGPSASIAMEELVALGVKRFIRVGTCGGISTKVLSGDIVIPTGAIRMEGTSKEYLPIEFPAVPSFEIVTALFQAAKFLNHNYHMGVIQSKDSFYGQHEPERMPVGAELQYKWNAWKMAGTLASEMECAALFTVAACLKVQVAAVLMCVWNQERAYAGLQNLEVLETDKAIKTAIEALRIIILENR
jgi:uridine phosphorylase